jgi:beta-lactam-binding protein with PASTA domain
MDRALAGVPNTPFTDPSTRIAEGEKVDIPDVNRMSVDDARAALQAVGFSVNVVRIYSGYRSGVVIGTNPRNTATRGSAVVLYVSRGPNPNPPAPTTPVAPAPPPPG